MVVVDLYPAFSTWIIMSPKCKYTFCFFFYNSFYQFTSHSFQPEPRRQVWHRDILTWILLKGLCIQRRQRLKMTENRLEIMRKKYDLILKLKLNSYKKNVNETFCKSSESNVQTFTNCDQRCDENCECHMSRGRLKKTWHQSWSPKTYWSSQLHIFLNKSHPWTLFDTWPLILSRLPFKFYSVPPFDVSCTQKANKKSYCEFFREKSWMRQIQNESICHTEQTFWSNKDDVYVKNLHK